MLIPILILFFGPFIGVLLNIFLKVKTNKFIGLTVLFSGAFLMGISLFGLMPELYEHGDIAQAGIWLVVGFFFQIVLEKFTGGLGHGHIHKEDIPKDALVLFVGLFVHALLEGYSAGVSSYLNPGLLSGMVIGIAIHEIPASFALSILLGNRFKNKKILYGLLFIYVLTTPLGYSLGTFLHKQNIVSNNLSFIITAIIAGTFLHISTTIVFESSLWKKEGLKKWLIIFAGLLISFFACELGHQH